MPSKQHMDNFGVQAGAAYVINMNHTSLTGLTSPDDDVGPIATPSGYSLKPAGQTGVTDNGDDTFTLVGGVYLGEPITFSAGGSVSFEITDTAGTTIEANTLDQSTL